MRSLSHFVAALLLLAGPAAAQVDEGPVELKAFDACVSVSRGTFLSDAARAAGFSDDNNDGAWDLRQGEVLLRISRDSRRLRDGTTLEQCVVVRWPASPAPSPIASGMADRARRMEMTELPARGTPDGGAMRTWATEGPVNRMISQVTFGPSKERPNGSLVLTVAWIVK